MDVQQLRSWIFELYDPLTEDRSYILFDRGEGALIDLPPYSRRALLRIEGVCRPTLVFFTHAGRAADVERWRTRWPGVRFAIHEADADGVAGIDRRVRDGEEIARQSVVINIGAHTPGASVVLVQRLGGVLIAGDAVVGTPRGTLALPDPSYADPERVRAGIEKLRTREFSAVLSTRGAPVWSAGKDRYLALLAELPRADRRFGYIADAPWDQAYRRKGLVDQMTHNPIVPENQTIAPSAGQGPSTLVPAWERKAEKPVGWEGAAAPARAQAGASEAKQWSLAKESVAAMPPRPRGPVETLPLTRVETPGAYRRLDARELLGVPHVDFLWRSLDHSSARAEVVFSWNPTGDFELYRSPVAGDAIYQITAGPERALQPRYAPDGRRVAFLRDTGGDERFAIWLVAPDGSNERRLTSGEATRYSIAWSPDGARIAYVSDEGGRFGIWLVDVATGASRGLVPEVREGGDEPIVPAWSPDGRFVAYHSGAADDARRSDVWIAAAQGGQPWRLDAAGVVPGRATEPAWSPDGAALAFSTDARGHREVVVVPMRDGRPDGEARVARESHFDDSDPVWELDGRSLLYARTVDATVSVRRLYLVSRDDEPALDAPGVHSDVHARPDGGVAYLWSGARRPADVFVKARDEVAPRAVTRSLPAAVDPGTLVEPRHVRYPGADGVSVPALLYLPHPEAIAGDGARPPAVVYVHGGPTAQHFVRFDETAQWFANRGYVVLAPNVRGSSGYGRAFRDLNRGDWGGKDLQDAIRGADWLEHEGIADGRRLAIYGASYGGYLTLMALARAPRRWAAGCSVVGIVSLETLYRTTRADLRVYLDSELGSPERVPDLYRERSPLTHVKDIAAPLLILQGKNDPRVPPAEAQQVVEALRRDGKAFSFHVYEDEGHGFRRTDNFIDALVRVMEFFDEHVKERSSPH